MPDRAFKVTRDPKHDRVMTSVLHADHMKLPRHQNASFFIPWII
jgi:hypothetical protein